MKRYSGKRYPNGQSKFALIGGYLSCRDFGCSYNQYIFDLAMIKEEEQKKNTDNFCHWYKDKNGKIFVDQILLADDNKRILITEDSFKMINKTNNVFISYAKEDRQIARKLYGELKGSGARPWLDEKNLCPGQHWEIEIEEQINKSDYFIALLSSKSVSKRGYVQREIRLALEVLGKLPEKEIYIIPARVNECQPSHKILNRFQIVDLFPNWDKGVKKILHSLELNS